MDRQSDDREGDRGVMALKIDVFMVARSSERGKGGGGRNLVLHAGSGHRAQNSLSTCWGTIREGGDC